MRSPPGDAGKDSLRVLLLAADPAARRELEAALAPAARVTALAPEALCEPARWLDAAGAVALVTGCETERDLARLEALRGLPAGRAVVLVAGREAPAEWVLRLAAALDPRALLDHPASGQALRFALARALPDLRSGEGARPQQRRAPALLGVSSAIRELLEQVRQVAASRAPVLILGETGTGKELVARAIHEQSPRARQPFVAVNCGALPESLLEAALFGVERGAFTGAERARRGFFEEASGGTLLLDEIGDTTPALQVKLLRALESGEIRPVGGAASRTVDVRIVSATHRDLEEALLEGSFRRDLLYRLNAVTLYVPPLRRRAVDIPFLAQHFAEELGSENARRITLADDFIAALARHDFPGNVRELRNAVERAIALAAPGEPISDRHLPSGISPAPSLPSAGTLRDRVEQLEIQAIQEALDRCGGNRTRAARALGLSRLGLRQKMRRLGLERGPHR